MKIIDILPQSICDNYKIVFNRTEAPIICSSKEVVEKYFGWMKIDSFDSIIPDGEDLLIVVDDDRVNYLLNIAKQMKVY